mgnify:CR=1 FL=1
MARGDIVELRGARQTSVGFLIAETTELYVLAATLQFGTMPKGVTAIPKGSVDEIRLLRAGNPTSDNRVDG